MAAWSPEPTGLQEILTTLHKSTEMADAEVQRNITETLHSFIHFPNYIAYLAHVLAEMTQEDEQVRTIAGYLLKNNARLILKLSPEVAQCVKAAVLRAFDNESVMIQNIAGQTIVSFLEALKPENWPECLSQLINMLDSEKQEVALNVLENACEDHPRQFDIEIGGAHFLDYMVPKFLDLTDHSSSKMRSHAFACLSYFVPIGCRSVFMHMDVYMGQLSKWASDEDPSVRRHVCRTLVLLLIAWPEKLMPNMASVAELMLRSTKDVNEYVALEACEFWLTFAENVELASFLKPLLEKVAPALLEGVICGEDDERLNGSTDDATVPDKDTDIKPRHYSAKTHGFDQDIGSGESPNSKPRIDAHREEDIDCDDEYDFECGSVDDEFTEWNLRKCAATTLDLLAVRFGGDLLNVLLVPLKDKLWSNDWLQRESGILALGAIAEGCFEAMKPHLPILVPYLVNILSDRKALVRSTTCWTLGRFSNWTSQCVSDEHKQNYFIPTMEGLLCLILDNNKGVQAAACSAFATLQEDAGVETAPYLEHILQNLIVAFDKYQQKNMPILYDAVGTLADTVGSELSKYVEILMPPLGGRWAKLQDTDIDLIPLFECLTSVVMAMGHAFLPYVSPVFERCCSIIYIFLLRYQQFQQNPEHDEPDESLPTAALGLLSGLIQGLGMQLQALINQSEPNMLALLMTCLKHPQAPVRQFAYALVGDMAMNCSATLRPIVPHIVSEIVPQLDLEPKAELVNVLTNMSWSIGEVVLCYGQDNPESQHWVNALISRLIPILVHPVTPRGLRRNAAVTIGKIGLVHPGTVAPHLPNFAEVWGQTLYEMRDSKEKDLAFRGLCATVQVNPSSVAKSLLWLCNLIVHCEQPSPELNSMFVVLLQGFKQQDEVEWASQAASFHPTVREQLAARYGV